MSLEHHLPGKVSKELLEPLEPFYDVDEKEAEDINSCLNFLSILDDEDSTDSCNFTLFRKKDDNQRETENNVKTCQSIENNSCNNNNNNNNNHNNNNVNEASSSGVVVFDKTGGKSDKPEFDLTKPSASSAVFKNKNKSTILFPASKTDSSLIKGKNNIILKIPSITPKNSPPGQRHLLQSDKPNHSQNINCTEFKIFKKKVKNISKAELTPKKFPKFLKGAVESAKEGEILLKNPIVLPFVSAARNRVSPVKQSCTFKTLQTLASPDKQCAIENSKMVWNERNSKDSSVLQSPIISGKISDNDKKTENGVILKICDAVSLNNESKNDVIMIPACEDKVSISKNSPEVPEAEIDNPINLTKYSLEIPHSEFENAKNLVSIQTPPEFETSLNIPKLSVEISHPHIENTKNPDKNSLEVPQPEFDNAVNSFNNLVEVSHQELESTANSKKHIVEIPCSDFEDTAIIQENTVDIPCPEFDDSATVHENSVEIPCPEFDESAIIQENSVEIPYAEFNDTEIVHENSVEIPCPEFDDSAIIQENSIEIPYAEFNDTAIGHENSVEIPCPEFDDSVIIQENSVEIPHTEFEDTVNLQDNVISTSPPEFENIVNTQKDIVSVPSPEPKNTINIPKNLIENQISNNCKIVTFFNSFSSVEITQHSPQEEQKDTQQMKDDVKKIKRRRNNKSEETNKSKNRKNTERFKNSKKNEKTNKSKTVSKEMYKPLKRMGLPTFLNHNDSQDNKESKEDKVPETSTQNSLSIATKELDFDKIGGSLDETSLTSSLNSDHTSDSLFILRDNHPDPNNKNGSSEMIDKLHSYCHSSRVITNEQSTNNSNSLESNLEYESISSEIVNNYSQNENVDQLFIQPLDNSHYDENMFSFGNEALNIMSQPEIPTLNFNEISKTLVDNQEFSAEATGVNGEQSSFETLDTNKSEEIGNTENKTPFCYSFNKFSPLSFTIQNVLENMYKYEPFPSSANMARLAKVLLVQWRDIRNWFVSRRTLDKKNGMMFRNKSLTSCNWCPNATDIGNDKAIVHLLSRDHIVNMVPAMERHKNIFSQVHQGLYSNSNGDQTEMNTESSGIRIDEAKEHNLKKSLIIPTETHKINEKHKVRIDHMNINNEIEPLAVKDKAVSKLSSKSPLFENKTKLPDKPPDYFKVKDRENYIDRETLKVDKNIGLKVHYDSSYVIGYRCPDCIKIFSTEWMLIKHSLLHKKFICSECKEVFAKEEDLKYHFKEHLIESIDDDLYRYYVCFKCYNLNCICTQDVCRVPFFGGKNYVRPQKARRSKPFRSVPHSGINEHLKVTLHDFWSKYKKKHNSSPFGNESAKPCLTEDKSLTKSDSKNKKNISKPVYSAPTYTNITTFNCNLCESFFFTHDELEEHLAVHKIQANNKRRKKHQDDDKKKKLRVEEDATQAEQKSSVCYYCNKSFKRYNILVKHLKFFCKSLPFVLQLKLKNSLHIEKVGRSNKFKLKDEQTPIENKISPKSSTAIKHKLKKPHLSCNKLNCQKGICEAHSDERDNSNKELHPEDSIMDNEFLEGNEDLYLCKFCNIPLESMKLILLHIGRSCSEAPSEVIREIHRVNYRLIGDDHTKYFRLINRTDFHKILPLDKIKKMLDIETFLTASGHEKRFKCKFCEKLPFKYWLKLHLTKHCKYVPKELHYAINRNSSRIFSSSKYNINKSPLKIETLNNSTSLINGKFKVDIKQQSVTETSRSKSQSPISETSSNLFYDCHLCEEKFKISKDFITHMQNFHCMNISEKSCYKWLTKVDKKCSDKIPPDNSLDHQQENDSLVTYDSISSEIFEEPVTVNDLSKEVTIASVADDPNEEVTIVSLADEANNVSNSTLPVTPNKGQKLDEELLSDDFEQFGNFFETVQLEDSAFGNASS